MSRLRAVLRPSAWWVEIRHAARRLRRHPGHSGAAVLTLALGVAASISVFALVHGVLLSPLPYPESDRIVEVDHVGTRLDVDGGLGITYGFFRFYEQRVRSAESLALYSEYRATLTGEGEPARLNAARATPSLASVLGTEPVLGRWFVEGEGDAGEPQTTLLSHGLWRDRFGADPSVVGQTIRLNGVSHEIVGVMPESFTFPASRIELWTPRAVPATGIGGWNDRAVARLASGATPASLEEELRSVIPRLREASDDPDLVRSYLDEAGVVPRVRTLKEGIVGDVRATLWILLGTVGFVLAVAVANVANLFLVRAEQGARDSAVRTALGAGRLRIAQAHLAEALLVTGTATGVGVALAAAAIRVVRARAPVNIPRLQEVGLDPVVLGVAAGVAILAALALGILPALRGDRDVVRRLKDAAGRATGGGGGLRGRNALVATQVALALVLLVGSGLLLRTFAELRSVDLGFAQRDALTFRVALPGSDYPDRTAAARFHETLAARLAALPGVTSAAAVASCLPLSGNLCWGEVLRVEGRDPQPEGSPIVTGTRAVSPGYLSTLGVRVRGRGIQTVDAADEARVAVLSESAAAAHFPGEDAIGRRVSFGGDGDWYTVVGVAGDVRVDVGLESLTNVIYLPVLEDGADGPPPHDMAYVLSTDVAPAAVAGPVREAVADLDPSLPVAQMESLEERIARATAPAAFALVLVGLAGLMSLVLGAVGVYAVTAYAVSRRTSEIGLRMALGARTSDVRAMILRQNGASIAAGAALGLAGAAALTRLMTGMLYGVSAHDPVTYATATLLMVCVGGLALWLPARRGSRVDPAVAMRAE